MEATQILIKTTNLRSKLVKDYLGNICDEVILKIRKSNKFYNQNIHNNNSLFAVFSSFLSEEESSDDEDFTKRKKNFVI